MKESQRLLDARAALARIEQEESTAAFSEIEKRSIQKQLNAIWWILDRLSLSDAESKLQAVNAIVDSIRHNDELFKSNITIKSLNDCERRMIQGHSGDYMTTSGRKGLPR